ncbi:MAG: M15 family metallopeptidase [Candidatus Marinimicrobia bacterium]|nr:M15 family metallopeptidase [Candidatus Neomarinimicrobiota bacterium]
MQKKSFGILLLLITSLFCAELPTGFIYLEDIIPDLVLDLRYLGNHNFLGVPVDGYEAEKCIITEKASKALSHLAGELKNYGLGIKVFDAYRPQRAVDHFVRWARVLDDTLTKQEFYPTVDKKDLFEKGYIAEKSSHSRGSTIDLTLVLLETGEELDMGSPFDYFGELSHVFTKKYLTAEQRAHRMLLQMLMDKHGFNNYSEEWWHFTLRDEPFTDTWFDFVIR